MKTAKDFIEAFSSIDDAITCICVLQTNTQRPEILQEIKRELIEELIKHQTYGRE